MWILPRLARNPRQKALLKIAFPFTHHRITLAVFDLPPPARIDKVKQRWVRFADLNRLPLPSPHRRATKQLVSGQMLCSTFRVA
jgi:hypothetical protein